MEKLKKKIWKQVTQKKEIQNGSYSNQIDKSEKLITTLGAKILSGDFSVIDQISKAKSKLEELIKTRDAPKIIEADADIFTQYQNATHLAKIAYEFGNKALSKKYTKKNMISRTNTKNSI